jgi:hypothetical protein
MFEKTTQKLIKEAAFGIYIFLKKCFRHPLYKRPPFSISPPRVMCLVLRRECLNKGVAKHEE